jgi:hypothetical protein
VMRAVGAVQQHKLVKGVAGSFRGTLTACLQPRQRRVNFGALNPRERVAEWVDRRGLGLRLRQLWARLTPYVRLVAFCTATIINR